MRYRAENNIGLIICDNTYISGWWYTYPSEKYEFVSWDYDIPNIWKNKHGPNHQPDMLHMNIL